MFAEITSTQIPHLKNIMVSVEYNLLSEDDGPEQPDVTDYEVLVYDEYSADWHNITALYILNAQKLEMLMQDVSDYLISHHEPLEAA